MVPITFIMIALILPGAEDLPWVLAGTTNRVRLNRMNYHNGDWATKTLPGGEKYVRVLF